MANIINQFRTILLVMLFYSFCITLLSYGIPSDARQEVVGFSQVGQTFELETISSKVQSSLQKSTNMPIIELGALVFYSGNILIDLLLNFTFAIPQMIGLVVNGLTRLIGLDAMIGVIVQVFSSVVLIVLYFMQLIQLLNNMRSSQGLV